MEGPSKTEHGLLREAIAGNLMQMLSQGLIYQVISRAAVLVRYFPKDTIFWNLKGIAEKNVNRSEEAASSFKKIIEIDPKNRDGFNNLGLTFYDMGRFSEALEQFDILLQLHPACYQALQL